MIQMIRNFFGSRVIEPTTEFSAFFTSAPSKEKKRVLMEVVRKANQDQRALVERFDKMNTKTGCVKTKK